MSSAAARSDYASAGITATARGASTLSVGQDDATCPVPSVRRAGAEQGTELATGAPTFFPASKSIPAELTPGGLHWIVSPQGCAFDSAQGFPAGMVMMVREQGAFLCRIASHQDGRGCGSVL